MSRSKESEIAYRLGHAMVPILRDIYRLFDGDMVLALVLGEVGNFSADPLFETPPKGPRQTNALSIAAASGIPRETVRRKLAVLKARGWVEETADGGLRICPDGTPSLAQLFAEHNRLVLGAMRAAVADLKNFEGCDGMPRSRHVASAAGG